MSTAIAQKINDRISSIRAGELPRATSEVENANKTGCSDLITGMRIKRLAVAETKIATLEWVLEELAEGSQGVGS